MKTISAALQTAIENGTIATAIKITSPLDGTELGFTNFDYEVSLLGVTCKPAPGLERIVMALRNNAEVSNQEMTQAWVVDLPDTELNEGKWDNAEIEVVKFNWEDPTDGTIPVFKGKLGQIEWNQDGFRADIHSLMRELQRSVGVQVTTKCRHQLYSQSGDELIGYCGVNKASFTHTGTIASVQVSKLKFTGSTNNTAGYFSNGIIKFTSGPNANIEREVKVHTNPSGADIFELFRPFPYVVSASDAYTVYAGCDKTYATCKSKFSNGAKYGGFPHIRNEINFK